MTSNLEQQYGYSKVVLKRSFNRAMASYDAAAVLQNVVGKRLLQRLDLVKLEPEVVIDLGSATGVYTRQLKQRYKKAKVLGIDLAQQMSCYARKQGNWFSKERYICADAEFLPLADNSVSLIFSNLMLQWMVNPDRLFQEIHRVLIPGGLLMFTSFGPDTLKEMRHSWSLVDDKIHVNRFLDMHDVGDSMTSGGFTGTVMDTESITMTYDSVSELHQDLRDLGEVNMNYGRRKGLTSPILWRQYLQAYQKFQTSVGDIPATWDIVYGHAWASEKVSGYPDIIKMTPL